MTDELRGEIQQLYSDCNDRGARIYNLCSTIWLMASQDAVPQDILESFCDLIETQSPALAIARQSITQLRTSRASHGELSRDQSFIITQTRSVTDDFRREEQVTTASFRTDAHVQERKIVHEIQLHRAKLFLQYSGKFDSSQEKLVTAWLKNKPKLD